MYYATRGFSPNMISSSHFIASYCCSQSLCGLRVLNTPFRITEAESLSHRIHSSTTFSPEFVTARRIRAFLQRSYVERVAWPRYRHALTTDPSFLLCSSCRGTAACGMAQCLTAHGAPCISRRTPAQSSSKPISIGPLKLLNIHHKWTSKGLTVV